MGALDAVWHVLNLIAPAVGLGLISAALAKLLWRQELRAVPWRRLAAWVSLAGCVVIVGGLVLLGHDGRMATYGVMVLAAAAVLWWQGVR